MSPQSFQNSKQDAAASSKEQAIIEAITRITGQGEAMADDAFWDAQNRTIYTTDMLVDGRHFSLDYFTPQALGWKAAAVNISDIAGMGGQLKYLLISIGLPDSIDLAWVSGFYEGLSEACQAFGGIIAGGDTVSSPLLTINVTAVGKCPTGHHVGRRFQARPGDLVIASGFHGLSYVGLQALSKKLDGFATSKQAHCRPMPRIEAGFTLSGKFERYALMDSSDGLADAAIKIAKSSGQRVIIEQKRLHVHPELRAYAQLALGSTPETIERQVWDALLYGGEDFELVATVPSVDADILAHFHVIGRVEAPSTPGEAGAMLVDAKTGELQPLTLSKTYQHFQGEAPV